MTDSAVDTADTQNKGEEQGGVFKAMNALNEYLCYWVPPGPQFLPQYLIVNFNKGTMMIYLFILMCVYDNFSLGAWIYLSLHGNYGIIWYIKDKTFPNPGFTRPATLISGLLVP